VVLLGAGAVGDQCRAIGGWTRTPHRAVAGEHPRPAVAERSRGRAVAHAAFVLSRDADERHVGRGFRRHLRADTDLLALPVPPGGGPTDRCPGAWQAIPDDVPILRSAVQPLLVPGRVLPAEIAWVLEDGLHLLAATPDAVIQSIGHPAGDSPDPILYFYEHFLAAYDHAERIRRGVYYTPRPLVDYLVNAVDDTLKSVFGKAAGLADEGVSLLDPAVGTGTFPLAAAQRAMENVQQYLGMGATRQVLEERVLPNFSGLELLPAPYTIAHVKFALFARDQHVRFRDKRARIYLTNTLGDPLAKASIGGMLSLFVGGLIDEARAAEHLKHDERILVIIGNPPWSATSHNKQPEIERLFAAWKQVDGKPIDDARIALNDDYLKFMRWAVWKLFEQETSPKHGILAFVTNHAFINGRIHRGVRKALLDRFDDIYVFNLQGNQRLWVKGVKDEKVFPDVQQGIAMTVYVRASTVQSPAGRVHYREMRGTRAAKYQAATSSRLTDAEWQSVTPTAPFYSFAPNTGDDRYDTWPSVPSIFPVGVSGTKTERDRLVGDFRREPLENRIKALADRSLSTEELKNRFGEFQSRRWQIAEKRKGFSEFERRRIVPWLYRTFDQRYIYWDPVMISQPGTRVMRHLLPQPYGFGGERRFALVVERAGAKKVEAIATVSRGIACAHATSQWCHVYPLRLAPDPQDGGWLPMEQADWRENLDPVLHQRLADAYGPISVEQVAWYVFGVLSAPAYREQFAAALAIDHPRVPFPAHRSSFDAMAALGERLGRAHLLEAPMPADGVRFIGDGSGVVEEVRYDAEGASVWINRDQRFAPVRPEEWARGLGFRPLEHFLDDRRGRRLDIEQIEMFSRAAFAVRESLELAAPLNEALAAVVEEPIELG
jgi:Predicted helicase